MPKLKLDEKGEEQKPILKFKNCNRLMRVPFVVYVGFEAFPENMNSCEPGSRVSLKNIRRIGLVDLLTIICMF